MTINQNSNLNKKPTDKEEIIKSQVENPYKIIDN